MTALRVISAEDIARTLSVAQAVEVLGSLFGTSVDGPPAGRQHLAFADGELLIMSAVHNAGVGSSYAGVKVVSVRNQNVEIGMPSVHASYMLFGGEALAPLALVDGAALTGFRTAAVSALATTMLARPDASRLVLFGAGVQAESHLTAMAAIRPLRQLTVVNGNAQRAGQLIELAGVLGIEGCRGDATSVTDADIVCTCTTSSIPVFDGRLLSPGTHINAIGSYHPDVRELDDVTAQRARWFVEEHARVFAELGDVLMPIASGAVGAKFVVDDLFGLCSGAIGRRSADEITVFKSVGLGIEDLAIAEALVTAGS